MRNFDLFSRSFVAAMTDTEPKQYVIIDGNGEDYNRGEMWFVQEMKQRLQKRNPETTFEIVPA